TTACAATPPWATAPHAKNSQAHRRVPEPAGSNQEIQTMTAPSSPTPSRWRPRLIYAAIILLAAAGSFLLAALLLNIQERKQESQQYYLKLADLDEDTTAPAIGGKNSPRKYDGYKPTVDIERPRHGGSEAFSKLEADPRLVRIFAGYGFSLDYREDRG